MAEAEARGAQALAVSADVADENAVASLFDQTEETFGGVDVVVNAAGVMSLAPLAGFDLAVLDRMLRTNIRGTFVVDQQAARRVRPGWAMTFILAHELRGRDVTVNAVAPGPTATDLFLEGKDEELLARLANAAPLQRLGTPSGIAPVVAFLASTEGHWINGQTIRINGGVV